MLFKSLSKCLLNTDRLGILTFTVGSLFQCLTNFFVKKCFLMSSLNLSCNSFEPVPCWTPGHEEENISTSLSTSCPQEAVESNKIVHQPQFLIFLITTFFFFPLLFHCIHYRGRRYSAILSSRHFSFHMHVGSMHKRFQSVICTYLPKQSDFS